MSHKKNLIPADDKTPFFALVISVNIAQLFTFHRHTYPSSSLVSPRTDLQQFTNLAISPNYKFLFCLCRIVVVKCKCTNMFWIF